jgi:hypothetical protein
MHSLILKAAGPFAKCWFFVAGVSNWNLLTVAGFDLFPAVFPVGSLEC